MSITKTREVFSLPNVHYADFSNLCLQKKFIDEFINTKKVGWNNQPTKCPLYLKN